MLVVTRFDVAAEDVDTFLTEADPALAALASQSGYLSGSIGKAVDRDTGWVMVTRWDSVGSYRRALSAFDVRVTLLPLTARAIDEPGAYEVIVDHAAANRVTTGVAPPDRSGPCGPKLAR